VAEGLNIAAGLIKQTVAQIEHLEEQKLELNGQIKEVFDHAKSQGLDIHVLKQLIKLRKKKQEDVEMEEELLELYRRAMEQQ
jgi:uncharacterized protein (UPF0335 family)